MTDCKSAATATVIFLALTSALKTIERSNRDHLSHVHDSLLDARNGQIRIGQLEDLEALSPCRTIPYNRTPEVIPCAY
jgi:hypothetical protein